MAAAAAVRAAAAVLAARAVAAEAWATAETVAEGRATAELMAADSAKAEPTAGWAGASEAAAKTEATAASAAATDLRAGERLRQRACTRPRCAQWASAEAAAETAATDPDWAEDARAGMAAKMVGAAVGESSASPRTMGHKSNSVPGPYREQPRRRHGPTLFQTSRTQIGQTRGIVAHTSRASERGRAHRGHFARCRQSRPQRLGRHWEAKTHRGTPGQETAYTGCSRIVATCP